MFKTAAGLGGADDTEGSGAFLFRGPHILKEKKGFVCDKTPLYQMFECFQNMEKFMRREEDSPEMFLARPNDHGLTSTYQHAKTLNSKRFFLLRSLDDHRIERQGPKFSGKDKVNKSTGYNLLVGEMQKYYMMLTEDGSIPELVDVSLFCHADVPPNRASPTCMSCAMGILLCL